MLPIAAVLGVAANSFRLAAIIKIPALWCVLALLNLAFMLFIVKLSPHLFTAPCTPASPNTLCLYTIASRLCGRARI
jgi:hypothetical protein